MEDWQEYERRKKELWEMGLEPEEYEKRLAEIVEKLDI